MSDFKYDDALTLRDAAKAIRAGAEWTPKMVEAVASLLDIAAEDIASAELRGASWARWEWTHYCFAVAAQALSEKAEALKVDSDAVDYECPRCSNIAPWTDGTTRKAGDKRDEFWCQNCGAESPLEDCREVQR